MSVGFGNKVSKTITTLSSQTKMLCLYILYLNTALLENRDLAAVSVYYEGVDEYCKQ